MLRLDANLVAPIRYEMQISQTSSTPNITHASLCFFSSDIIKHNGKDRRKAIFIRYCGIWRIYMFYASYAYNRIHIPCVSNRNWLINRQSICQKPFRWCDVTSTIFDNKYYGKVQLRVHSDGTTILRLG